MNNVSKISQFKSDTLMSLKSTQSPQALKEETLKILNNIGFSDFDLSLLSYDSPANSLASTLPVGLNETYCQEGMYEYDVALECLLQNPGPIFFSDIYKYLAAFPYSSVRNQKNKLIHELMINYGYADGYCIPTQVKGSSDKLTFFVLAKDESSANIKSLAKEERAKLNHLINTFSFLMAQPKILRGFTSDSRPVLTTRQREVLNALANFARTNQEVAEQLGITVRTVAKHVEDIKLSLGARSIPNAVSLAIGYGLILPAVR